MNFGGFQLTTTLDYPGEIATILFTKGCNMQCPYCHNSSIASGCGSNFSDKDILNKLIERKNRIDHVVISGGEPSIYGNELIQFIIRLKNRGFKVKIDTNGLNPEFIRQLLQSSLVDYIAMDIKTVLEPLEYGKVAGVDISDIDIAKIKQSIQLINGSDIQYEFRTTVIKDYHNMEILEKIAKLNLPIHYLQKFVNSDRVLDRSLQAYTDEEMKKLIITLNMINPNMKLRGV